MLVVGKRPTAIRKAAGEVVPDPPTPNDAENRLTTEIIKKLQEMAASALQDSAINAITAGQFEGFMKVLNWIGLTRDWTEVANILAGSAKEAGLPKLREAIRIAQSRAAAQAARTPSGVHLPEPFVMPPKVALDMAFEVVDQNVTAYATKRSAELVVQISDNMRETVGKIIVGAVNGAATPQEAARQIARIIPLHDRYARAVIRHEAATFDRLVREGMDAMKARAKAALSADKYAARLTRLRARTIARTEIMTASNYGQLEGYRSAIQSGLMTDPASGKMLVTKEWVTATDERVCPVCGPLHGMQVDFMEPFPNGGNIPPAHPNCRCSWNVIDNMDQFDFGHGETY